MDDFSKATACLDLNLNALDVEREPEAEEVHIPLTQWVEAESKTSKQSELRKASTLRRVNVSYAITKVLQHLSISSSDELERICSLDNFIVRVSQDQSDPGWEVKGIETVSPSLSLQLRTNEFSSSNFFDETGDLRGKFVDVTMQTPPVGKKEIKRAGNDFNEKQQLRVIGLLIRSIFSGARDKSTPNDGIIPAPEDNNGLSEEPQNKKKGLTKIDSTPRPERSGSDLSRAASDSAAAKSTLDPARYEFSDSSASLTCVDECPSAVSQLIRNLADTGSFDVYSDESYQSLQAVIDDFQLFLQEPERFLVDRYDSSTLSIKTEKLYGREQEAYNIKTAFCRVASSGESEAVFVSGYSGCGKTRLVQSVFESVHVAGGCVVTKKFDEISTQSPMTVVLSAFNDFCIEIKKMNTPETLLDIYKQLNDFGESFHILASVLPNVLTLDSLSDTAEPQVNNQVGSELNYHSVCFLVQQFMRVISSTSHPLVLFLDDLQWADPMSMGLVHSVLSDRKGSSSLFFVGSFRENEVMNDHIVFGLMNMLSSFDVRMTKIHLDGLTAADLNSMVCEAFGMVPRLCRNFSEVVFRKTNGNPFFAIEFLRSLVDRGIVKYTLRERRWVWNINDICAEDITDNVLYIITGKMTSLPADCQTALKVASCFGTEMNAVLVRALSVTPPFYGLQLTMDRLVLKCFIDFDGVKYRFVHDKVREAAYSLIIPELKAQYHFDIGVLLHSTICGRSLEQFGSEMLFATVEQINYGVPSLLTSLSQRISIAELNCLAGSRLVQMCNFPSALSYMRIAVSLLPDDQWTNYYQLSLASHLDLAKAAYPCESIDEAKESLHSILEHGRVFGDKLDSYCLLVSVLTLACNDSVEAFKTCHEVLLCLGENLSEDDIDKTEAIELFTKVKKKLEDIPEGELIPMLENENIGKDSLIMHFYSRLATVTFFAKPKFYSYYVSKWTDFCLTRKVKSKYTPNAIVTFASLMCFKFGDDAQLGCKIGRIGLTVLRNFYSSSDEAPTVYLLYYGLVGCLKERIQECELMHARGHEIAMQVGNTSMAAFNLMAMLSRAVQGGKNLLVLRNEVNLQLKKAGQTKSTLLKRHLIAYHELLAALIGDEPNAFETPEDDSDGKTISNDVLHQSRLIYSVYLGDMEVALENAKKSQTRSLIGVINNAFYSGISSLGVYRTNRSESLLEDVNDSLAKLEYASNCSEWNFKNKHSLLHAELLSTKGQHDEAVIFYDDAISIAHSSKFIHEEGLACELAALHYKKNTKTDVALRLLDRAEKCYRDWGSQVKIRHIQGEIQDINSMVLGIKC